MFLEKILPKKEVKVIINNTVTKGVVKETDYSLAILFIASIVFVLLYKAFTGLVSKKSFIEFKKETKKEIKELKKSRAELTNAIARLETSLDSIKTSLNRLENYILNKKE